MTLTQLDRAAVNQLHEVYGRGELQQVLATGGMTTRERLDLISSIIPDDDGLVALLRDELFLAHEPVPAYWKSRTMSQIEQTTIFDLLIGKISLHVMASMQEYERLLRKFLSPPAMTLSPGEFALYGCLLQEYTQTGYIASGQRSLHLFEVHLSGKAPDQFAASVEELILGELAEYETEPFPSLRLTRADRRALLSTYDLEYEWRSEKDGTPEARARAVAIGQEIDDARSIIGETGRLVSKERVSA